MNKKEILDKLQKHGDFVRIFAEKKLLNEEELEVLTKFKVI